MVSKYMKRIVLLAVSSIILFGCGTVTAKVDNSKPVINVENKEYQNMAAVNVVGSVRISDIMGGSDTPTEEMSEKVSKISKATLSVFDSKSKIIDTYDLKKIDPSTKGEVLRFVGGYRGIPTNAEIFKLVFLTSDNSVIFESQTKSTLKAKTIYDLTGELAQVSTKKDVTGKETITINIDEKKPEDYVDKEFLFGMKEDYKEEEIKELLMKNGIKVTELKKGVITATVKFSEPTLSEALIIATKLNKFDYVEPNGVVSIIGF